MMRISASPLEQIDAQSANHPMCNYEDIDMDGNFDIVCKYKISDLNLVQGTNELDLTGNTENGNKFLGRDT